MDVLARRFEATQNEHYFLINTLSLFYAAIFREIRLVHNL